MAKKSMIVKQQKEQKYQTREYNRCKLCGRPHGYYDAQRELNTCITALHLALHLLLCFHNYGDEEKEYAQSAIR